MTDKLTGLRTGDAEASVIDHAVESGLKELKHLLARDTTHAKGLLVNPTELSLLKSVEITELLLFHQTNRVVAEFSARLRTVDSRRIVATL
jgi:predicted metal-dependent TIM-barrel fold hydrolase